MHTLCSIAVATTAAACLFYVRGLLSGSMIEGCVFSAHPATLVKRLFFSFSWKCCIPLHRPVLYSDIQADLVNDFQSFCTIPICKGMVAPQGPPFRSTQHSASLQYSIPRSGRVQQSILYNHNPGNSRVQQSNMLNSMSAPPPPRLR